MRTVSVMLETLCAPCGCRCRYCLLSWDGRVTGADYDRSQAYAERFYRWITESRPDLRFDFSFGYAMEHPRLAKALAFLQSIGSVEGDMLLMDGLRMRNEAEADALADTLAQCGVKRLVFTFYGLEAYHDAFAGRKGDHALLLRLVRAGLRHGLEVSARLPLNRENAAQAGDVIGQLEDAGVSAVNVFIPHGEGRGAALEGIRFTQADFDALPARVQAMIHTNVFRSEADWLRTGFPAVDRRTLLILLTPESIARYEVMDFADVIAEVEALDEAYYGSLPTVEEMAKLYGDPANGAWYSHRDLYLRWQKRYIQEHSLTLYDVTDETQSGSRRF